MTAVLMFLQLRILFGLRYSSSSSSSLSLFVSLSASLSLSLSLLKNERGHFLMNTFKIPFHYLIEDRKYIHILFPFAFWPDAMNNPQWLELPCLEQFPWSQRCSNYIVKFYCIYQRQLLNSSNYSSTWTCVYDRHYISYIFSTHAK